MVKYKKQEAYMVEALMNKTRYDILERLVTCNELSAGDIADNYDMSFPAVSKHLKVLKSAQLVKTKREGRTIIYSPQKSSIKRMQLWVQNAELFWKENLDSLASYVESKK